jgi:hypothetical protein
MAAPLFLSIYTTEMVRRTSATFPGRPGLSAAGARRAPSSSGTTLYRSREVVGCWLAWLSDRWPEHSRESPMNGSAPPELPHQIRSPPGRSWAPHPFRRVCPADHTNRGPALNGFGVDRQTDDWASDREEDTSGFRRYNRSRGHQRNTRFKAPRSIPGRRRHLAQRRIARFHHGRVERHTGRQPPIR